MRDYSWAPTVPRVDLACDNASSKYIINHQRRGIVMSSGNHPHNFMPGGVAPLLVMATCRTLRVCVAARQHGE